MINFNNKTNNRKITIWSPIAGAGGTITAINLARLLTIKGLKVLLVDYDLKTPALSLYMGIEYKRNRGLEAVIPFTEANNLSPKVLESNILTIKGIDILPCTADNNISAMPENLNHILDVAQTLYDYVIVDTSGLIDNAGTYSALLSCGNCYVVVEKNAILIQMMSHLLNFIHEKIEPRKLHLVINKTQKDIFMNTKDIVNYLEIMDYKEFPFLGYEFINNINKGKLIDTLESDPKLKKYNSMFLEFYSNNINELNLENIKNKKSFLKKKG